MRKREEGQSWLPQVHSFSSCKRDPSVSRSSPATKYPYLVQNRPSRWRRKKIRCWRDSPWRGSFLVTRERISSSHPAPSPCQLSTSTVSSDRHQWHAKSTELSLTHSRSSSSAYPFYIAPSISSSFLVHPLFDAISQHSYRLSTVGWHLNPYSKPTGRTLRYLQTPRRLPSRLESYFIKSPIPSSLQQRGKAQKRPSRRACRLSPIISVSLPLEAEYLQAFDLYCFVSIYRLSLVWTAACRWPVSYPANFPG